MPNMKLGKINERTRTRETNKTVIYMPSVKEKKSQTAMGKKGFLRQKDWVSFNYINISVAHN